MELSHKDLYFSDHLKDIKDQAGNKDHYGINKGLCFCLKKCKVRSLWKIPLILRKGLRDLACTGSGLLEKVQKILEVYFLLMVGKGLV